VPGRGGPRVANSFVAGSANPVQAVRKGALLPRRQCFEDPKAVKSYREGRDLPRSTTPTRPAPNREGFLSAPRRLSELSIMRA